MLDAYQTNTRDALPDENAVRLEKIDLFWEDSQLGRSFACGQRKVTREEIIGFANQYDPQPFHLDEAFCAGTIYGGLIASGGHVWAICMGLVARAVFNRSSNMGSGVSLFALAFAIATRGLSPRCGYGRKRRTIFPAAHRQAKA